MTELESKILPYYFMFLAGFIILNMLMSLCLFSFTKIKNIQLLFWYWFTTLLTFALQGQFQYGELPIILSYSINVIPIAILSIVIFATMSKKAPLKLYFKIWLVALTSVPLLHNLGFNFVVISMPLSLGMGFIPLNTAYTLVKKNRERPSVLEKFLAVIMVMTFIHFINFSLFRMGPGNQLWGHAVSFALYQFFSISIFALIIESRSRNEKARLSELVETQTIELKKSLKVKETLFRMVLHDIATPIQGQLLAIKLLQKKSDIQGRLLDQLIRMTNLIKNVVDQVKTIEAIASGKLSIDPSPVNLDTCLNDVLAIFEVALKNKNLNLQIYNRLSRETHFNADQNVFTTSILGNLISNAIKFSPVNSTLRLNSFERGNKVIIELEDNGVGIPQEIVFAMFDPVIRSSRLGTNGEAGTGFGMIQVKSYVDHFGGQIDVESRPIETYPMNHGTKVTLTMDKSLSCLQ